MKSSRLINQLKDLEEQAGNVSLGLLIRSANNTFRETEELLGWANVEDADLERLGQTRSAVETMRLYKELLEKYRDQILENVIKS
jgi:hypothetical protein